MKAIYALLSVIAGLVHFYAWFHYGHEKQKTNFVEKCEDENLKIIANAASVAVSSNAADSDCFQAAPGICNNFQDRKMSVLHLAKGTVPEDIFSFLHHPSSPAKWNYFITKEPEWKSDKVLESPCQEIYMTRTGQRASQPNKCVAVAIVPEGFTSNNQQSHRKGYTALNTDQYQQDYPRNYDEANNNEKTLLVPFLHDYDKLISDFKRKMGEPIDPVTGKRRMAIVMVANTGVMDLLLNFICSSEEAKIDLKNVVVFVGQPNDVALVESLGANAIYSKSLGSMPEQAAGGYLDHTFSRMMWFKTTSVYLALVSGFEVMFQDVDLVWLEDPFPYFLDLHQDILFMDDGARTPRYTPFFVNSGFYFVKYNERTLYMFEKMMKCGSSEIGQTHSHQSVLIRHISEAHHLMGLRIFVLDTKLFPSGQAYHEDKPLIKKIQEHKFKPYVFHMCWTDNRENKVVYFKDVGLWYVSDEEVCNSGEKMLHHNLMYGKTANIKDKCCVRERYWPKDGANVVIPQGKKSGDSIKAVREKEIVEGASY